MSQNTLNALVVQRARERRRAHLAVRLARDPKFKQEVDSLKKYIAMGFSIDEAREAMGVLKTRRWQLMVLCVAEFSVSPEKIFLEYHVRTRHRYLSAIDLQNRARAANDLQTEAKMLLAVMKLDENYIRVAEVLGLMRPTGETLSDDGVGVSDDEMRRELELVREVVARQLASDEGAGEPKLIEVQSHPVIGGTKDRVG